MTDPRLNYERLRYTAIKDRLRADDPNIDEQTLADTVEGVSDFTDLLAAIMRAALDDETMCGMLRVRLQEMQDRLDRLASRAERRRGIVRDAMIEADMAKLVQPDFTVSVRRGQPHVVIVDEKAIPPNYWEQRPHLLKRALFDALKAGDQVNGAVLSNPGMTLSVRTR